MATIGKGYTFGSTEQVTNEKLHNLVDSATITDIVNGDINSSAAIAETKISFDGSTVCKLATTQTISGDKTFSGTTDFAGTTITDLGSVTIADINGGTIDGVTIGGASAPTVTNIDINGGTLDGVQIGGTTATGELIVNNSSDDADGLGSQGTSGQILQSAGAGANPTWGNAPMGTLLSATAFSAATVTGDITIAASKQYMMVFRMLLDGTTDSEITLRFNNDSTAQYRYSKQGYELATGRTGLDAASSTASNITFGTVDGGNDKNRYLMGTLFIDTTVMGSSPQTRAVFHGHYTSWGNANRINTSNIGGSWINNSAVTSIEFTSDQNMTGSVYIYELKLS